jgi:hypothetical protein
MSLTKFFTLSIEFKEICNVFIGIVPPYYLLFSLIVTLTGAKVNVKQKEKIGSILCEQ